MPRLSGSSGSRGSPLVAQPPSRVIEMAAPAASARSRENERTAGGITAGVGILSLDYNKAFSVSSARIVHALAGIASAILNPTRAVDAARAPQLHTRTQPCCKR